MKSCYITLLSVLLCCFLSSFANCDKEFRGSKFIFPSLFLHSYLSLLSITDRVVTKYGVVAGTDVIVLDRRVHQFLGIPYAQKPTRFQNPRPLDTSWVGDLLTHEFKPPCLQSKRDDSCEDCLYLNIWTPSSKSVSESLTASDEVVKRNKTEGKKPVMVYLHGGAFNIGTASTKDLNGSALAAVGDVIVVTLNYRLGFAGFLVSNDVVNTNMGLRDQQLAISWVKENIEYFNGDPQQITLFGHSAGSLSISLHLLNPSSSQMITHAIMQSGAPSFIRPESLVVAQRKSVMFSRFLNCSSESDISITPEAMKCLRSLPPHIITTYGENEKMHSRILPNPVRGESFLAERVTKLLSRKMTDTGMSPHSLIVGFEPDEGTLFVRSQIPKYFKKDTRITFQDAVEISKKLYDGRLRPKEIDSLIKYFMNETMTSEELKNAILRSYGDLYVYCTSLFYAEDYKKSSNAQVYAYSLDSRMTFSPAHPKCPGVCHGEEEPFVFGHPFLNFNGRRYSDEDRKLSLHVMKTWTTFAKTGHVSKEWQELSLKSPKYIRWDNKLNQIMDNNKWNNCYNFWKDIFDSHDQLNDN